MYPTRMAEKFYLHAHCTCGVLFSACVLCIVSIVWSLFRMALGKKKKKDNENGRW